VAVSFDSPVARARAAWPVVRAVGTHVQLTRQGRIYVGLCPFHGDVHRPNLVVWPATDTWRCFTCGVGGDGLDFLVRLTGKPLRTLIHTTLGPGPAAPPRPHPADPPAVDLATRDRLYRRLLAEWSLTPAHRAALRARGLSDATIAQAGFRSLLPGPLPWTPPAGVPGLYRRGSRWYLAGPPGWVLPVADATGRVQAVQIRPDVPTRGKYRWWSTAGRPGGASSGAPAHVAGRRFAGPPVWITEGPLKAVIAAPRLQAPVIGVPGAHLWDRALAAVAALRPRTVILAFDQDADPTTAAAIGAARTACAAALQAAGYRVRQATWPPVYKGLDDALVGGASLRQGPLPR